MPMPTSYTTIAGGRASRGFWAEAIPGYVPIEDAAAIAGGRGFVTSVTYHDGDGTLLLKWSEADIRVVQQAKAPEARATEFSFGPGHVIDLPARNGPDPEVLP